MRYLIRYVSLGTKKNLQGVVRPLRMRGTMELPKVRGIIRE